MAAQMTSRERMLAALGGKTPDYVPCSFMIFSGLGHRSKGSVEFIEKQVALGLDTVAWLPFDDGAGRAKSENGDLAGFPIRFGAGVKIKEWCEQRPGERYPLLHREYTTPAGSLHTAVHKTADWVQGERVPLFDDFIIPRAKKRLISGPEDLPALRHLLTLPTQEDIAAYRERAASVKQAAAKHHLLVSASWGVLFDCACWLAGMEELCVMAYENPAFFKELLGVIGQWNRKRMEFMLDGGGVDLFVRRGWYEIADFLQPAV